MKTGRLKTIVTIPAGGVSGWRQGVAVKEERGGGLETVAGGRDGGLVKHADPWLWPCAVTVRAWQSCLICGFRLAAGREADNHTDQNCVDGRKGVL